MAFTIERRGTILILLVTEPKVEGMPRGLAAVQRCLDEGGITEVRVGFDEQAWNTAWVRNGLTALEATLKDRGIPVRVLGTDARLEPLRASEAQRVSTPPASGRARVSDERGS
jgi:hypothetical protein